MIKARNQRIAGVASLVILAAMPFAAQSQGVDAIKQVLLSGNVLVADGNCGSSSGSSDLKFSESGGKVTVAIWNSYNNSGCTRDVTVTETGFKFDGCRDTGVVMTYNAADKAIPFKGQGARCTYVVKPK